ncbi:MAG: tRNA uridine(34) 5-carboxymethylaminomethyl modification radical SAM/GNAT enzyme Elp3 [Candidatus Pacebacteria bacterium]|nr:tRNA uridine(34) 5-carboxymethylaminomethyl modification radical SAM/GNAT enzyme Elp3 [Candidatus Paceibacterota bacterium]
MIKRYIIEKLSTQLKSKKEPLSEQRLSKIKRAASRIHKVSCPTNIELLREYRKMVAEKTVPKSELVEKTLITKEVRTESGVAIVAILTKPYPCPGKCAYCPDEKNMPKSYLSNEPAVMRAVLTKFRPYEQVRSRLESLEATGHKTDKIELIVMGGTFSYLPKRYQNWFIKECFRACNEFDRKKRIYKDLDLEAQQRKNEKTNKRIVGLTLETRPDYIDKQEIIQMRKLGATRVELGVQSIYDDVLKLNRRGHGVKETVSATKLLKEAGFKINYHMMPELPGSDIKRDIEMFQELFSSPDFQPDMIKVYPCVVVKGTLIYKWFKTEKYKAYSNEERLDMLSEIKKNLPYYVRVARLIRDIPSTSIIEGNKITNLRQELKKKSDRENWKCKCIRCREIRGGVQVQEKDLELFREDYDASEGKEIFLTFEDKNREHLYSMLRLRINSADRNKKHFIPELRNAAIVREVHTYGKLVPVKTRDAKSSQHIGLGRKLLEEAEKIAREEFSAKKIAVISGVGVRDYYRKNGYKLEGNYMVKNIKHTE